MAEESACSVFRNFQELYLLPIGKQGPVIQSVTAFRSGSRTDP
jgi:hypothetical protein